jgi:hypothetical protein
MVSRAFSFYWNQISSEPRKFYDLRNTYATAIVSKMGAKLSGRAGLYSDLATTIEHYQNEEAALKEMEGMKLFG